MSDAAPGLAPAPAPGSVLIAIVNYRTAELVVQCLQSLAVEVGSVPGTRVVVVDNCSGDGSAQALAAAITARGWSGWATLLASPVNGGFSHGNNLVVRPALNSAQPPAYVWLLNPDTTVYPGALRALTDHLDAHPEAGIAGSRLEGREGEPWRYAFRFPSIWSEFENGIRLGAVSRLLQHRKVLVPMTEAPARVDWLPGASMMVRRAVFDAIGLMDEGYFLYYEETDFCLQARRAGWECWYVPHSRVMHIAGQSTGVTGKQAVLRRLPDYWFESRRRYYLKNHGRPYAVATDLLWLAGFSIWRLRRRLQRRPEVDPPRLAWDFLRHSTLFHGRLPVNRRAGALASSAPAAPSAN